MSTPSSAVSVWFTLATQAKQTIPSREMFIARVWPAGSVAAGSAVVIGEVQFISAAKAMAMAIASMIRTFMSVLAPGTGRIGPVPGGFCLSGHLPALFRTTAAGFGTALAVFLVGFFAFRGAGIARFRTGLADRGADLRLTAAEGGTEPAEVGAIQATFGAGGIFADALL